MLSSHICIKHFTWLASQGGVLGMIGSAGALRAGSTDAVAGGSKPERNAIGWGGGLKCKGGRGAVVGDLASSVLMHSV
jgi:hypothetical protein